METFEQIMGIISRFITNSILPWSVVVFILILVFKKPIMNKIKELVAIEITKDSFTIKFIETVVGSLLDKEERQERQNTQSPAGISEEKDALKLKILQIYSEIEAAIKDKFGVKDIYDMFTILSHKGKMDTSTFIILTSMELLRDEILSSTATPEMTRKNIDTYKYNADRIKKIIKEIEI
jgi:hypothetical protein